MEFSPQHMFPETHPKSHCCQLVSGNYNNLMPEGINLRQISLSLLISALPCLSELSFSALSYNAIILSSPDHV